MFVSKSQAAVFFVFLILGSFSAGILTGFFSGITRVQNAVEDESIIAKLREEISNKNIEANLKFLTKEPHIAGRSIDEVKLVNFIKEEWNKAGLDPIQVYTYDVLLSYPRQKDSNYVTIVDNDGREIDQSQTKELVIDPEQNNINVVNPFNAYSAAGNPQGELVYVNYGKIDDFIFLNRSLNINLHGKICIARYGKIFRGDKAKHAEMFGCAGLILYSDPADYTVPWSGVYPDDWYLPSTGAQRGTLILGSGDLLTPNYPSIDSAWRIPEADAGLPKIPVTPIGYVDAIKYLSKLGGAIAEQNWQGGLNITYKYGPGFASTHAESKMKMHVTTYTQRANIHNVIGYIRGQIEPDRHVLLGNHRDAWVFGAIDPSSGTAVFLEVVRAFGEMIKKGWKPRRSLVFCSWGAEEHGLIGSTEWVEEMQKVLESRAVAYLNVDISVQGNHSFQAKGVPSLRDVVYEATKLVDNPNQSEIKTLKSVYDSWKSKAATETNLPEYNTLGSGSDYTSFQHTFGIPSMDMRYSYDKKDTNLSSYPVYHSVYETFELVNKYLDPGFKYHQVVGQIWAEIGRKMADSLLLPFNFSNYADHLLKEFNDLKENYGYTLTSHGIELDTLENALRKFQTAADLFHESVAKVDTSSFVKTRMINDQMMQLEKTFLDFATLPGRKSYRHVMGSPSQHDSYSRSSFPGIVDSLFDIESEPNPVKRWNEVRKQYSIVVFHALAAANFLKPIWTDS